MIFFLNNILPLIYLTLLKLKSKWRLSKFGKYYYGKSLKVKLKSDDSENIKVKSYKFKYCIL